MNIDLSKYKSKESVRIKCAACNQEFLRTKKAIMSKIHKGYKNMYCSSSCRSLTQSRDGRVQKPCAQCGNMVSRVKSQAEKSTSGKVFCNSSCSATYNNKKFPKRKAKKYLCKSCGAIKTQSHRLYCDPKCSPNYVDWSTVTIKEVSGSRMYQKSSRIRALARKKFLSINPEPRCFKCGYDKHIEVCHIKGIYTFEDSTFISEVNSMDNLVGLCRNCHWEFDNGLLSL